MSMPEGRERSQAERNFGAVGGIAWIVVWMFPLLAPIGAVVGGNVSPAWPAVVGLVVFVLAYVLTMIVGFGRAGTPRFRAAVLAVTAVTGVTLAAGYAPRPGSWLIIMMFVGIAAAGSLPSKPGGVGVLAAATVTLAIGMTRHVPGYADVIIQIVLAGALVLVVRRMTVLIDELRETRRALADAAVAEERLRFARDLHDLLGHTLSVIVVKAEVVRRMAVADPPAAAQQATEIEQIGRQALVEIREAVTGYREGGLAEELDRARASLRDAGIEPTVRTSGQPLPPTVDALLTWAVREGVTNVIRHSQARTCRIEVGRADSRAYTEIVDDGGGGAGASPGNGLRGLTERMAAVGGEVCAGPAPGGGYRLTVNLPLDPFPRDPSRPRDPAHDHERSGAHSTANPS
jgi:two-component system, NarL family, sensor histidine kinase DesK